MESSLHKTKTHSLADASQNKVFQTELILIHIQVETNYPRPGSQALESLRIDG